jgi:O-antigen/teichoic acid export membrane protein
LLKIGSIKTNFIMNFIRVSINLLFPLITFPYIFRVLQADGVGKVSFAQGVTSYFILLSGLGLSIYGIRAVAKVRDDKEKLSKLVMELLLIILISTIVAFLLFIGFINIGNKTYDQKTLFMVFSLSLIFKNSGVEWFYQGIEQYKYITLRDISFKIVALILLFLLVKEETDYIIYAFILVFSVSGSAILNFINLRKYIDFKISIKGFDLKRHFKPILLAFGFSMATSIYVNLDTVMLGYLSSERAVGLYTASIRITKIVVVLVTTLGYVLIPRISYYIENGNIEQFRKVAKLSANFTFILGLPAVIGFFILAPDVILIFAGDDFSEAVTSMRIIVPIILFLGFSNFIGIQILYPYGKEKIVLFSVLVGAAINLIFNLILIPRFSHEGAAIATLLAEGIVLLIQIILARHLLNFLRIDKNVYKIVFSAVAMGLILILINSLSINVYFRVILSVFSSIGIYFSLLLLLREELICEILKGRFINAKKI